MKFDGRIIKVLPVRSGVSQNGGEWKVLPFVFAYKENADDRWEDRVLLETMDRNHMAEIAMYCVTGDDKKVVVEDDHVKLKTEDIKCRCGFSHGVREITSKDGRKSTINNMRVYELTIGATQQPLPVQAAPQQPAIPAPAAAPLPTNPSDNDLPF